MGTIVFSGLHWLWPAAGLLVFGAGLVLWSYRRAPAMWVRGICPLLKLAGLTALGLCLLEPLWLGQRARSGANLFAIVADNSQSLRIKDRSAAISRGEMLRALLNPQRESWQATLEDNFDVRRYFFDARLQSTRDFEELNFDGRSSAIGSALRTIAERYRGRPLAGVLLFTDGNATDLRGSPALSGLPPI